MGNIENGYNIGIVGATGAVGREFCKILETRQSADLPIGSLRFFGSEHAGERIRVGEKEYSIEKGFPNAELFRGLDFVLTAVGDKQALEYSPAIAATGAINVDKSNAWRMDPNVPLVVPEVNPDDAQKHKGIIAGPNCSTIQLVVALWPIHQANHIQRIRVATYQAVSGMGLGGIEELQNEEAGIKPENPVFPRQVSHNVFPEIGSRKGVLFGDEQKMIDETRKIMHLPDLPIDAECVRVPVMNGHSEIAWIELTDPMDPEDATDILAKAEGLSVSKGPTEYISPLEASGKDEVFVGRVRKDMSDPKSLCLWIVADNLRKGAALNAFQVFELVARNGWIRKE